MSITITTTTTTTTFTNKSELELMNELVEESISMIIQEAVSHFNKNKSKIRYPEDDCRFFYNDEELNLFLKQMKNSDKIWVSTITDDNGKFYAYRVGRIVTTKRKGTVKY